VSRIGRKPITVPAGVEVKIDGSSVTVKGPKGTLSQGFSKNLGITLDNGIISVTRPNDEKENRALHGLTRSLISNMVTGVTEGYTKSLDIEGIGYRAVKQGANVVLTLGFSHQVTISDNADIKIEVPAQNKIIISGIDKQKVGQFAAEVREIKPPEPYKGKGIRYTGERIIRKEGKAGKGKK
jgi:large subunit ribosomal protein L6